MSSTSNEWLPLSTFTPPKTLTMENEPSEEQHLSGESKISWTHVGAWCCSTEVIQ